ncbi:MAG: hypothetical protein IH961_08225 [Chloroflexi bacterium]|nr:hypothetical protein [Chloroflexota bacterium]
MTETLRWLLVAEVIGLAAFPIAHALFPGFRDRGWGLAKPLGLIIFSFSVWILGYTKLVPNSGASYWTVVIIAAAVGGYYLYVRRASLLSLLKREWPAFAASELIFIGLFLAWTAYRAYDPSISGTEKPMDLLFLNASVNAPEAPPADPWLAGSSVPYYYFGYWMFGAVSQMASVPTFIAFNLSTGLIAGLAGAAVFSLTYNLVRSDHGRQSRSLLAGGAAAVLLLVSANLIGAWEAGSAFDVGPDGVYEWVSIEGLEPGQDGNAWRPTEFWWWWRASRVTNSFDDAGNQLDFTIQEFPFFSLLLGDLHAHLMSIPFVLLAIALLFQLMISPARWGFGWIRANPLRALALAIVIGALGFINAWDFATLGAMLFLVATLKTYRAGNGNLVAAAIRAAPAALLIGAAALAIYSPFYFGSFSSQVSPGDPIGAVQYSSRYIHLFTIWGLALLLIGPFLAALAYRPLRNLAAWFVEPLLTASFARRGLIVREPSLSTLSTVGVLLVAPFIAWVAIHLVANDDAGIMDVPQRIVDVLPLAIAAGAGMYALAHRARNVAADGGLFALMLVALSLYMLYGVELLFVRDLFGNRMNTLFKVYYQVWIFLAVAGAYALHYWSSRHGFWRPSARLISKSAAGVAAVLVVVAVYYPVAAAFSKANGFSADPTLDGLRFVSDADMSEREAINWLNENTGPEDTVVEAVGGSYSSFGRISSATGRPTVLGWAGHEHQWRGTREPFDGRAEDIETIYTTANPAEASELLDKYGVDYVYVGRRERQEYGITTVATFDGFATRVFESGQTVIFRIGAGVGP